MVVPSTCLRTIGVLQTQAGVPGGNFAVVRKKIRGIAGTSEAARALALSVACTLLALFVFGFVKGSFTGARPIRSALQTGRVGGLAAGAAFRIALVIS
jgi:hypothetical protein